MSMMNLLPNDLKTQLLDNLVQFLARQAEKVVGEQLGDKLRKLSSEGGFLDAFDKALKAGGERFVAQYTPIDEDLVAAITADRAFWQSAPVRQALIKLISRPGAWLADERETVTQHFADVLPARVNRERVDKAVTFFLQCVAEELWTLPGAREVREVYRIKLEQYTADALRQQVAVQQAQLRTLDGLSLGMREALLQLTAGLAQQRLLPASDRPLQLDAPAKPRVFHNLPQPDYGRFIGREAEFQRVLRILRPYPHSQHALVTIDGIGGIGKSALALEIAHSYLRNFERMPADERFEAIIWTSAKQTVLTASGIVSRRQALRTLDDIYTTIAVALQREDITRAKPEEQAQIVIQALTRQRTLLIVDNLETVDDEAVMEFLRELPAPTKAIVTTRHRLDVAYPVRLAGLPWEDARKLIAEECQKKNVSLSDGEMRRLYDRTGGVPLAVVWSIAQMGMGYGVETVLARLGQPSSDIARFCFEGAALRLQGQPAHQLLMALSIFVPDGSREALSAITELSLLDRDDGLAELEKLSLVNRNQDRFSLLPLTKTFALAELQHHSDLAGTYWRRWIEYLKRLYLGGPVVLNEYYWRFGNYAFFSEGPNLLQAIQWCYELGTAEDVFALTLAAIDYLDSSGRWTEIDTLNQRALELARSIQDPTNIARFANNRAWLLEQRGELAAALEAGQESLAQYRLAGNREGEVVALQRVSGIYRKCDDLDQAQATCDLALKIALDLKDEDLRTLVDFQLGKLARAKGNWQEAWDRFSSVGAWFERQVEQSPRDEQLARSNWGHLAIVAYRLGRPQEAKDLCLRSLEFFEQHGTKGYLATLKYRLALAEEALGEVEAARLHVREAVDWFERLGMRPDYAEAKTLLDRLEA